MHLGPDELVDLAERAHPESDAPHLLSCVQCRAKVDELRRAMALAAEVDVPEPSPLFWPHLSARVHDAVSAAEAPARRRVELADRVACMANRYRGTCRMCAGDLSSLRVSHTLHNGARGVEAGGCDAVSGSVARRCRIEPCCGSSIDADVRRSQRAREQHARGSVDEAITLLSTDERAELQRLLNDALKRPGD